MKIARITAGQDRHAHQFQSIYGAKNPLAKALACQDKSISHLFLLAVNESRLPRSAQFASIINTGISQLRAYLTADASQELNMLLSFMQGDTRGESARRVSDLIESSKSDTNIINNQEWWSNLYKATGIADPQVQNNIFNQVRRLMSGPAQGGPVQGTSPLQRARTNQTGETDTPSAPQNGIEQHRQQEQAYNSQLAQKLEQIRQGRESNQAEITKLLKAIEDKKAQLKTESICSAIAYDLLQHPHIVEHLSTINQHIAKMLGVKTTIVEAGLADRLKSTFRNAANIAANPGLAASSKANYDSHRAAKLATQLITQHLRAKFDQALITNKINPDSFRAQYQEWQRLQSGTLTPQQQTTRDTISNNLKMVWNIFGSTYSPPTQTPTQTQAQTQAQTPAQTQSQTQVPPTDSLAVAGSSGVESPPPLPGADSTTQAPTDTVEQNAASATPDAAQKAKPSFTAQEKSDGKQLLARIIQASELAAQQVKIPKRYLNTHQYGDNLLSTILSNAVLKAGLAEAKKHASTNTPSSKRIASIAYKYFSGDWRRTWRTYGPDGEINKDLRQYIAGIYNDGSPAAKIIIAAMNDRQGKRTTSWYSKLLGRS